MFTSPLAGEVGVRSAPGEGGASDCGTFRRHPHPIPLPPAGEGYEGGAGICEARFLGLAYGDASNESANIRSGLTGVRGTTPQFGTLSNPLPVTVDQLLAPVSRDHAAAAPVALWSVA